MSEMLFPSFAAILDIALVLIVYKGDIRLTWPLQPRARHQVVKRR
jgi:hypothetical protein